MEANGYRVVDARETAAPLVIVVDSKAPAPTAPGRVLTLGSLQLDMRSGRCTKSGRTIRLSARETALLEYLLLRKGRTVPRGELMQHVWHREDAKKSTSLNVYVRLLRMKVENDPHEPRLILTVPRVGYRLDPRGA